MRLAKRIQDLSLRTKLIILLAAVGIVPLVVTFFLSYGELRESVLSSQRYAADQSFEQSLAMLGGKFSHIDEISSMIIIDESLGAAFSADPDAMAIPEQLAKFQQITDYTNILQNDTEFDGIVYYIDERFVVTSDRAAMYRPLEGVREESWVRAIEEGGGEPVWVLVREPADGGAPGEYLALGRMLWHVDDYSKPVGIVTIRLDPDRLLQYLRASAPDQLVYLETEDGERIAANRDDAPEAMRFPVAEAQAETFTELRLASGDYLVRSARVGDTNLYLRSMIAQQAAAEPLSAIRSRMLVTYLIVSALLLIVIFPVTRSVTSRIFLLMNKMTQVRQGRLHKLDIKPREDEVGHLVSSYNYMIDSVKQLLDEQYKLGQEKLGAELKALQSQINPHFLYNTLDMMVWMAQKDERRNIQEVLYALSDYYKLILNKGEDFVTVWDELRLCALYIEIQQKRFKGRIAFVLDFEEAARECLLPKITLQPLVENAVMHGILEKPEGGGTIAVRGSIRSGRLTVIVEDDGPGLHTRTDRRPDYRGSGYGLRNIERRLELYFGEPNGIRHASREAGPGTCVIIDVPAVYRNQEERA